MPHGEVPNPSRNLEFSFVHVHNKDDRSQSGEKRI